MKKSLQGCKPSVAAVVVLFQPELELLRSLYQAIHGQVQTIWFIDNTPDVAGNPYGPHADGPAWDLTYVPMGDNLGIAAAQNVGIAAARLF